MGEPGETRRERKSSGGPGFLSGLCAGVAAGVLLVAALPSLGDGIRAVFNEFGPFSQASASSPGTHVIGPPTAPAKAVKASAPALRPMHFAQHRPLTVGVFGDSLGDGLWAGLYREMRDGKTYEVVKFSRPSTGLTRYDYVNVQATTAAQTAARPVDIAIIIFGTNDQQGIVEGKTVYAFGTPGWRTAYAARIDALVGLLRSRGAVVYWVGLPRMQKPGFDKSAQMLNGIYAERMAALGVPFIPTVPVTSDERGAYNAYLAAGGAKRLMRAQDGIHMTMAGYLRLAEPVAARVQTDVARASPPAPPAKTTAK